MCDTGSMWIGIFPMWNVYQPQSADECIGKLNESDCVFVICVRMRLTSQALLFIKQIWYKRLSVRISMAVICSPCTEHKYRENGQHWLCVCVCESH